VSRSLLRWKEKPVTDKEVLPACLSGSNWIYDAEASGENSPRRPGSPGEGGRARPPRAQPAPAPQGRSRDSVPFLRRSAGTGRLGKPSLLTSPRLCSPRPSSPFKIQICTARLLWAACEGVCPERRRCGSASLQQNALGGKNRRGSLLWLINIGKAHA